MRFRNIAFVMLVLLMVATLSCKKELVDLVEFNKEQRSNTENYILKNPGTIDVTEDQNNMLISVDSSSLIFQKSAALPDFKDGQILLAGPNDQAPFGYLRRIESISETGDQIILSTSHATYDEAFAAYRLNIPMVFESNHLNKRDASSFRKSIEFDRKGEVEIISDLDYQLEFNDFTITKEDDVVQEIEYTLVEPLLTYTLKLKGTGMIEGKIKDFPLTQQITGPIIPVGSTGLLFCTRSQVFFNAEAVGTLLGEIGGRVAASYNVGYHHVRGSQPVIIPGLEGPTFNPILTAQGSICINAGIYVDLYLEPQCQGTLALKFRLKPGNISYKFEFKNGEWTCKLTLELLDVDFSLTSNFFGLIEDTDLFNPVSLLGDFTQIDITPDKTNTPCFTDVLFEDLCIDNTFYMRFMVSSPRPGVEEYKLLVEDEEVGIFKLDTIYLHPIGQVARARIGVQLINSEDCMYSNVFESPCLGGTQPTPCFGKAVVKTYCTKGTFGVKVKVNSSTQSGEQYKLRIGDEFELLTYNIEHDIALNPSITETTVMIEDDVNATCKFEQEIENPCTTCNSITDGRDGEAYCTVIIGEQTWFAENLRYAGNGGEYFNDDRSLGRYYTWDQLPEVCPTGWRVPAKEDWDQLLAEIGGIPDAGGALKGLTKWNAPNSGAEDEFGYNALGNGYQTSWDGIHYEIGNEASFWTSTPYSLEEISGYSVRLSTQNTRVDYFYDVRAYAHGCRCIEE